jgi:transglutaminase/protease-like cytokinesis protein 3
MKFKAFIIITFITFSAFGNDFKAVDKKVEKYPNKFKSVEKLAELINRDFKTDAQKARAAYYWITNHIKYDVYELMHPTAPPSFSYRSEEEKQRKIKGLFDDLALKTLKSKKAVCQGYATLFKAVCDLTGVESELVVGHSKTNFNDIGHFNERSDHAWNVVKFGNKWHLVDATWGAGYVNNGKFHKKYSDVYFMQKPSDFALKHYPEDKKWLLTKKSVAEFKNEPLFFDKYFREGLKLKSPTNGTIRYSKNNKVKFKISGKKENFIYAFQGMRVAKVPENLKKSGSYITFEIEIPKSKTILTLFYENESILSYKIVK